METDPVIKAKGDEGEAALNKWFQDNNLCYLFISQDSSSFASLFRDTIKRPDFLLLIESVGLIAVDAKNYKRSGGVYTLKLEEELVRVLTFERLFRIPVWYAYRGKNDNEWYWISGLKALEVGVRRNNTKKNEEFLAIKLEHFAAITSGDDIGKLYTQRHSSLKNLKVK